MKGDSFLFVILSNSEGSECIAQPSPLEGGTGDVDSEGLASALSISGVHFVILNEVKALALPLLRGARGV